MERFFAWNTAQVWKSNASNVEQTLEKEIKYSEWDIIGFKFAMRKHRLKITERF